MQRIQKNAIVKDLDQKMALIAGPRQAGDSLAGRYFLHHLMPLSRSEITQTNHDFDLNTLITKGNFPEPFLA